MSGFVMLPWMGGARFLGNLIEIHIWLKSKQLEHLRVWRPESEVPDDGILLRHFFKQVEGVRERTNLK